MAFILVYSELLFIFIELMNYKKEKKNEPLRLPKGDRILESSELWG